MTEYPICLTLTRQVKKGNKTKTIKTTDAWARAYAAKKLGVSEDEIEVVRDGTIIKCRVIDPNEEEIEFLSFDNWVYETFGFPDENDEFYDKFKQFGYNVWLINAYPDEFSGNVTMIGIRQSLEIDYHWYRLETFLGEDFGSSTASLEAYLPGNDIVYPKGDIAFELPLNFSSIDFGFLLWSEDLGEFVLFVTEDDDYVPMLVKASELEMSGEVFDGWEGE